MHQNDMRMHRQKFYAPTRRLITDQNCMCTRKPKLYAHVQTKIFCGRADQISCARADRNFKRTQRTTLYVHAHFSSGCVSYVECAFQSQIVPHRDSDDENQVDVELCYCCGNCILEKAVHLKFIKNIFSIGYETVLWKYKSDFL